MLRGQKMGSTDKVRRSSPPSNLNTEILRMTTDELNEHIEKSLLENPTLERIHSPEGAREPALGHLDWQLASSNRGTLTGSHNPSQLPVTPEFTIESVSNRLIVYAAGILPNLRICREFQRRPADTERRSSPSKSPESQVLAAIDLLRNIEYRHELLYSIINYLFQSKESSPKGGNALPNPISITEAAMNVGVDDNTFKIAIENKYVQTPMGMLTLSEFFKQE
jgi:DNA-directed RNA polymerase specialized sigma54-like protein